MNRYEEQGIKVFRMNDYDWYGTEMEYCEDINDWYNKNITDNAIENVIASDLDKEGVWIETTNKNDIDKLKDVDEICTGVIEIGGVEYPNFKIGDLHKKDNVCYKLVSFREIIKKSLEAEEDFSEPVLLSTLN
ncbi:hypothetical protein N2W52_001991 [Clostridium perfringens]|nr:hypothetical protein [Clostridium perfringens]MDK0983008.1 hypothetical protein [Clostridium perfringens]